MESLEISYKINSTANIVRCCTTIEHIRHKLSHLDLQKYAAIMKEVYYQNEKKLVVFSLILSFTGTLVLPGSLNITDPSKPIPTIPMSTTNSHGEGGW